jgi:hypothetical protein
MKARLAANRTNRAQRPRTGEHGFVTIEFLVAVGFSLLVLVMITNLVMVQFGRGVVRAAVDEGARAGARLSADPVQVCLDRTQRTLESIGQLGDVTAADCELVDGQVRSVATADFEGWLPFVPVFTEDAEATARLEVEPQ